MAKSYQHFTNCKLELGVQKKTDLINSLNTDSIHLPDGLGGLVWCELEGRQWLKEWLWSEEDQQFPVFDDFAATSKNFVALVLISKLNQSSTSKSNNLLRSLY
jgi:hypothetical protein